MKNLSGYMGQKIELVQPSVWKTYYELKSNSGIIGRIRKTKTFGFELEIEVFNKKWIFYRPSFWRSEVAIRESVNTLPYAKYKGGSFKKFGMVELPKGERIKRIFKTFKNDYEIQDSSGRVLIKLIDKVKYKTAVEIFIEKKSEVIDKYPWIIILAWYISAQRKHAAAG